MLILTQIQITIGIWS